MLVTGSKNMNDEQPFPGSPCRMPVQQFPSSVVEVFLINNEVRKRVQKSIPHGGFAEQSSWPDGSKIHWQVVEPNDTNPVISIRLQSVLPR